VRDVPQCGVPAFYPTRGARSQCAQLARGHVDDAQIDERLATDALHFDARAADAARDLNGRIRLPFVRAA